MSRAALARRSEKAKKDRIGYIIIGLSLIVVIIVIWVSVAAGGTPRIDQRTGCVQGNRPPEAHTVVLIDETDALSRDELAYAKAAIINEYFWLPVGGKLTVRNIVADMDTAEDITICRLDDGSNSAGVVENPRMIRQTFHRIVGRRLEELYGALRTAPRQNASPIMEYVDAVADRADFGSNIHQRRLVLISDMAQHSSLFSQYGRGAAPASEAVVEQARRDLSGVHVRVHYIVRPALRQIQSPEHRQFWTHFFQGMDAADVAVGHGLLIGEDPSKETWTDGA